MRPQRRRGRDARPGVGGDERPTSVIPGDVDVARAGHGGLDGGQERVGRGGRDGDAVGDRRTRDARCGSGESSRLGAVTAGDGGLGDGAVHRAGRPVRDVRLDRSGVGGEEVHGGEACVDGVQGGGAERAVGVVDGDIGVRDGGRTQAEAGAKHAGDGRAQRQVEGWNRNKARTA